MNTDKVSGSGTHLVRAGVEYDIIKDTATGLHVAYADGKRIGATQTEEGAKLIRRNHARAIERRITRTREVSEDATWSPEEGRFIEPATRAATVTPWEHEPPTPADHPHPYGA